MYMPGNPVMQYVFLLSGGVSNIFDGKVIAQGCVHTDQVV